MLPSIGCGRIRSGSTESPGTSGSGARTACARTPRARPSIRSAPPASLLGVPYAAPPVGALRWRPPQTARSWEGVRLADKMGALCIQPPAGGDPGVGPGPMSEDCLTLNVWAPIDRGTAPLPVMVWIHGGGFTSGAGSIPWYHGNRFAAVDDIVVVAINYRLGVLGFTHLPELGEAYAGSVNCGILDQVAALHWVADNIAAFGGDPQQITVFGESAGAFSVGCLLVSPLAKGLFHRAIAESGAFPDLPMARKPGGRVVKRSPWLIQTVSPARPRPPAAPAELPGAGARGRHRPRSRRP